MTLQRTPLFHCHQKYQGRLIDFGGWELPVQYFGVLHEHRMVREKAGLFDVSHMGEITVQGKEAEAFLHNLLSNDIQAMHNFQVQYNIMCYPDGGVVDDLLVYRYNPENYLLVVNAANTDKDYAWIQEQAQKYPAIQLQNVSKDYAQLAVQGPLAEAILQKLTEQDLSQVKFFHFQDQVPLANAPVLLSRTGYTGEDGFEIYLRPDQAPAVWEAVLQAGGEDIVPVGLGARDTLRFEAKLPLYGQEISATISPIEANLGFFVKLQKPAFIGRDCLAKIKEDPNSRRLVEFVMTERGIPRAHYPITQAGQQIGEVTTGAFAPTLNQNLGLALLERPYTAPGTEIEILIRDKPVKARVDKGLFYSKKTKTSPKQ